MSVRSDLRRFASGLVAVAASALMPGLALAAPAADDIRDIRGPIAIPPWWRWPLAIAVALALAIAVVLLVRWWRARSRELSPLERALRTLNEAEAHARAGRSHAWADLVAETTRGALAARLGGEVLPRTTSELANETWAKPPLAAELDAARVLELLTVCDLARFAKADVDPDALASATGVARAIVERLYAPPPRAEKPTAAPTHPETVTP